MNQRVVLLADSLNPLCPCEQAYWLASELGLRGVDVQLISLRDRPSHVLSLADPLPAAAVTGLGWPMRPDVGKVLRLIAMVRRLQPAVIHGWGVLAGRMVGLMAAMQGHWALLRTELETMDPPGWLGNWIRRYSPPVARIAVHSSIGQSANRLPVIEKGVAHMPAGPAQDRAHWERQLGVPPGARLIGTVAPLVPHSRLKDVIWATDLLHCIRDDVYLVIIGDGPLRWRLERFGQQAHIAEHLRMIGWNRNARQILSHLDLYWQPSAHWPMADGLLHAMSAGVPVVAADTGSNAELISHRVNGFLAAKGARDELARWANQLLDDSAVALEIGKRGQEYVQRRFSLNTMVQRYLDQYRLAL